jgi:hypothetical protein
MIQVTNAAPNDNSNGSGGTPEIVAAIDALPQQMTAFQLDAVARFEIIDATLLALEGQVNIETNAMDAALATLSTLVGDETDELDGAVSALRTLVGDETAEIDSTFAGFLPAFEDVHGWVDAVANPDPDPFTTTVTTCAEYGGSGELGIEFTAEVLAELAARGGVNLFGTGITAEVKFSGTAAGKLEFLGFGKIFQEVCYAGVEVEFESEHPPEQDQQIADYTQTAEDFQPEPAPESGASYRTSGATHNGVTLASSNSSADASNVDFIGDGSLLTLASALGADITGMADALNGLAAANVTAVDPTALFSGSDQGLNDFIDVMGPGGLPDSDDFIAAFTDPCGTLAGLGPEAALACESSDTGLSDSIIFIEQTVTDIDAAFDAFITDTLDGIETTVSSIETTVDSVDSYMRTTLKSSVDGVRSVVDGIRSAINSMRGVVNHMFDLVFDAWDCVTFTGICGNGH